MLRGKLKRELEYCHDLAEARERELHKTRKLLEDAEGDLKKYKPVVHAIYRNSYCVAETPDPVVVSDTRVSWPSGQILLKRGDVIEVRDE